MENTKYYLIAKSIYDRYIETSEYVNVYDFVNKPIDPVSEQIVQDHLDTITSIYFDESGLGTIDWDFVLDEITKMIDKEL